MSVIISEVAHNDDNKPGQEDDGGEDDGDDEPEKEGKEPT